MSLRQIMNEKQRVLDQLDSVPSLNRLAPTESDFLIREKQRLLAQLDRQSIEGSQLDHHSIQQESQRASNAYQAPSILKKNSSRTNSSRISSNRTGKQQMLPATILLNDDSSSADNTKPLPLQQTQVRPPKSRDLQ